MSLMMMGLMAVGLTTSQIHERCFDPTALLHVYIQLSSLAQFRVFSVSVQLVAAAARVNFEVHMSANCLKELIQHEHARYGPWHTCGCHVACGIAD